jgi:hypothetical protein
VAPVRVVLEAIDGDGIGALVYMRQGEVESSISCYPPDALTLALRASITIYATPDVLRRACAASIDHDDSAQWLQRVRPEDFES